jgi:hypothetical protein
METVISEKGLICKGIEIEGPIGEQRVWTAVLLQAVEDLQSVNQRLRLAAEQFLFQNQHDFEFVCAGAGINGSNFRSRLKRHLPHTASRAEGTIPAAA